MKRKKLYNSLLLIPVVASPAIFLSIENIIRDNQQHQNVYFINNKMSRSSSVEFNDVASFNINNVDSGRKLHTHGDGDREVDSYTYKYQLNLKNLLDDKFIGDWNLYNETLKRKVFEGTQLNFVSNDDTYNNINWRYRGEWFSWGNHGFDETKKYNPFSKSNFDLTIRLINDGEVIKTNYSNRYSRGGDYASISSKSSLIFNSSNKTLLLNNEIESIASETDWGGGWTWVISDVWISPNNFNSNLNITLPYTKYDLTQFKELFEQVVAAPIRLKNVKNPILFDYGNDGTNDKDSNEYKIRETIEQRAKTFYSNTSIVNKLGYISNSDGTRNEDVSHIKLYVEPSIRGKKGTQTVRVRFNLGKLNQKQKDLISVQTYDPNCKFYFNENEAKSYLEYSIKIFVQLDPSIDTEIDDLVKILPFKSASNEYEVSYEVEKELKKSLGGNDPDPLTINSFNIDLNQYKENGVYKYLIPKEKWGVINKVGTVVTTELILNIEGKEIIKEVKFERLFSNGKIFNTVNYGNELDGLNFGLETNQINLCLEIANNEIRIFNTNIISLTSTYTEEELINKVGSVKLSIGKTKVEIPSEQITRRSKWVQTKNEKIFEKENLKFVGEFKTFDPFIFEMNIQNLPLYDPITNEFMGYASKYKPFIRKGEFNQSSVGQNNNTNDYPIFPLPETGDGEGKYQANLGSFIMKNKTEAINGEFKFQIVIKEYDDSTKNKSTSEEEKYTKDRWIISVSMNLLTSKANFEMSGYKDNELIKDENEQKYFNEESDDYRGDYVNEETGMYIPKIVWVNAYPPEAFLFDPLDQNGNAIVPTKKPDGSGYTEEEEFELSKRAKYDVGYIAELNATGFAKSDYSALPTFGGYETFFDTSTFNPTGLIPYSEFYTYNKNSIIPNVEKIPLSQSGLQTTKSTADFRQIIL